MNFKQFFYKKILAPNSSGFFHTILFEYMKYYGVGKNILLVCEPEQCCEVFREHFSKDIYIDILPDIVEKDKNNVLAFKYDLNTIFNINKTYDTVFCQAILEHVCRPSVCIENLSNMTNTDGIIIIMSHSPPFPYHRYPIDCVRFYKDFYEDLQRYLPIQLIEYEDDDAGSHFVVYRKKKYI